jgi:hypothetical protein
MGIVLNETLYAYEFRVETDRTKDAGTDNRPDIKFYGTRGSSGWQKLGNLYGTDELEKGDENVWWFMGGDHNLTWTGGDTEKLRPSDDVGDIVAVRLRNTGHDKWRPLRCWVTRHVISGYKLNGSPISEAQYLAAKAGLMTNVDFATSAVSTAFIPTLFGDENDASTRNKHGLEVHTGDGDVLEKTFYAEDFGKFVDDPQLDEVANRGFTIWYPIDNSNNSLKEDASVDAKIEINRSHTYNLATAFESETSLRLLYKTATETEKGGTAGLPSLMASMEFESEVASRFTSSVETEETKVDSVSTTLAIEKELNLPPYCVMFVGTHIKPDVRAGYLHVSDNIRIPVALSKNAVPLASHPVFSDGQAVITKSDHDNGINNANAAQKRGWKEVTGTDWPPEGWKK